MKKIVLLFNLMLIAFFAEAQQKGSLTGHISDENGYLPGASISIKGTTIGTATNLDGKFQLSNVPVGRTTILISYVGYENYEQEVDVKPGINDLKNIRLKLISNSLAEIIVQGTMAPSQQKALSIKKNAGAIMDVMAADAIGKLPDRNAAEAVQRMQGVAVARYHGEADQATVRGTPFSWTSTMLNGTRMPGAGAGGSRSTVLDAVPSEIIQYVQVVKAITPDMEGDAIGGSINFVTRVAPQQRVLNASAAGGYNQRSQNGTYNASLVYGDRLFNNKLGFILSASIWNRNWATDELTTTFNSGLADPVQRNSISTVLLKRYMGTRRTIGINAGLEYVFNSSHKVFARGLWDKFDDIRPVYESYYDFNNKRYQYNYRYSHYQTPIKGLELGGEHQLTGRVKVDWGVSNFTSRFFIDTPPTADKENRGLPISTFRQAISGGFGNLSSDGRKYLSFDAPDKVGDDPLKIRPYLNDEADLIDPEKLTLSQLVVLQLDNKEDVKVGQLNVKFDVNEKLSFKAGAKYRSLEKEGVSQRSLVYVPGKGAAPITLSSLQTTDFPKKGGFMNEIGSPYDNMLVDPLTKNQLFDLYKPEVLAQNGFQEVTPASSATLEYKGTENVVAGYIMADYQILPKLKIIGGVRDEYTALTMRGTQFKNEAAGPTLTPLKVKNDYHAILPMVHFKYALNSKAILRAAYTRSFVRPNFPDLNPGESVDLTKSPGVITRGNTELKPTFATNYDLMGEYYFKNIGLLSAGLFYKDISNFIVSDVSNVTIDGTDYIVTEPKNLRNAKLLGIEAGISKRLDFLPGFLNGFGVEFNYSRIESEVKIPRTLGGETQMDKTSLPNQSKNLFNAILFYEKNGIMARLAGNYRGNSVETLRQQQGPSQYTWAYENFTLDFSGAYSITKKLKAFVEINNLTNEPLRNYIGDKRRLSNIEWYSIRGQAGLRLSIF